MNSISILGRLRESSLGGPGFCRVTDRDDRPKSKPTFSKLLTVNNLGYLAHLDSAPARFLLFP